MRLGNLTPDELNMCGEKVDELWGILKTIISRAKQQRGQKTAQKLVSAMEKLGVRR